MSKILNGAMAAGLATMIALGGSVAASGPADAGHKHRWHNGQFFVQKHAGISRFREEDSCGYYYWKWQHTGNWKWYGRWQRCIHGG